MGAAGPLSNRILFPLTALSKRKLIIQKKKSANKQNLLRLLVILYVRENLSFFFLFRAAE